MKVLYVYNDDGIIGHYAYKHCCWPGPIYARQIFIQLPVENTVPYCSYNA